MSEAAAMTYRSQREKAGAVAYAQALRHLQEAEEVRAALADAFDAVHAQRLEARMKLEKARQAAIAARGAVLAQAWGAGHFKDDVDLGAAVTAYLTAVA